MVDFAAARRMMVDGQVRTADVTDLRIQNAMLELPRERFVPEDKAALAYLDLDLAVSAPGQPVRRLLKPMVLAKLLQAAAIAPTDRVLDVGCATGYSTVLLSRLGGSVIGLEENPALAKLAGDAVSSAGLPNVRIVTGPLARGCPAEGPFDVIVLEGSAEVVPSALFDQLRSGGRLVGMLGRGAAGKAMLYRRNGDLSGRPVFDAAAALLPGFAKPAEFVF
jgi:protein-L-isoaspartate(D-aspartate) O-methyltransferase